MKNTIILVAFILLFASCGESDNILSPSNTDGYLIKHYQYSYNYETESWESGTLCCEKIFSKSLNPNTANYYNNYGKNWGQSEIINSFGVILQVKSYISSSAIETKTYEYKDNYLRNVNSKAEVNEDFKDVIDMDDIYGSEIYKSENGQLKEITKRYSSGDPISNTDPDSLIKAHNKFKYKNGYISEENNMDISGREGIVTYKQNNSGYLIEIIKGNDTTIYTYDSQGRIKTENDTLMYSYNNDGKLKKIVSENNQEIYQEFYYDSEGDIKEIIEQDYYDEDRKYKIKQTYIKEK